MSSTDVVPAAGGELAPNEEAALAASALSGLEQEELVLPILQIAQSLSKSVTQGEASPGDFVNSLTEEIHGNAVGLIIAGYFKGRFYSPPREKNDENTYVAQGDVAPNNWPEEFAGRPFADIPEAEEQTRIRANEPGGSWTPPLIQTTHNYIGVLPEQLDMPVRLSLKSSSVPAHRKIATLLRFSRAPWDNVFNLETKLKHSKRDEPYYVVEVARGRETTAEERQIAVDLATAIQTLNSDQVKLTGETDERKEQREQVKAEAAGDGGLDVT